MLLEVDVAVALGDIVHSDDGDGENILETVAFSELFAVAEAEFDARVAVALAVALAVAIAVSVMAVIVLCVCVAEAVAVSLIAKRVWPSLKSDEKKMKKATRAITLFLSPMSGFPDVEEERKRSHQSIQNLKKTGKKLKNKKFQSFSFITDRVNVQSVKRWINIVFCWLAPWIPFLVLFWRCLPQGFFIILG